MKLRSGLLLSSLLLSGCEAQKELPSLDLPRVGINDYEALKPGKILTLQLYQGTCEKVRQQLDQGLVFSVPNLNLHMGRFVNGLQFKDNGRLYTDTNLDAIPDEKDTCFVLQTNQSEWRGVKCDKGPDAQEFAPERHLENLEILHSEMVGFCTDQ